MALPLFNNAEGGSNGTTVSTSNSGGASGTAWDSVNITATGTYIFSTTHAAHGNLAYEVAAGSTGGPTYGAWSTTFGSVNGKVYFRIYLYLTAIFASGAQEVIRLYSTFPGTPEYALAITPSSNVAAYDDAGSQIIVSTSTISLNQWFRVEGWADPVLGQTEFKFFASMDSVTPTETKTSTTGQLIVGPFVGISYGNHLTDPNLVAFWYDDVGASSTGYIGPVASLVPYTPSFRIPTPRLRRQPKMYVNTPGLLPGKGLSGIPEHFRYTKPAKAPKLQQQPSMSIRTGMLPGLGLSGIPPMHPVQLPTPRLRRQSRMSIATGFLPGKGLSGIPEHFRYSKPAIVQRQPRQSIQRGERGSLTVPVPVPIVLRDRRRIRPVPQRLVPGIIIPPFVYPSVNEQTIFVKPQYKLRRQPKMYLATGMLPGTGLSGIPVRPTYSRPAQIQRQPRFQIRTGWPAWGIIPNQPGMVELFDQAVYKISFSQASSTVLVTDGLSGRVVIVNKLPSPQIPGVVP